MASNESKRGNKEPKKPKQEKLKPSATANYLAGKPTLTIAGKTRKQVSRRAGSGPTAGR